MDLEVIKSVAEAYAQVTEAEKKKKMMCEKCGKMHENGNECDMDDDDDMDEAMDPVGKADADIDNDGDVDKSDKYLHNRRKAIKKSMSKKEGYYKNLDIERQDKEIAAKKMKKKGETATMNPKLDNNKSKGAEMEQKESRIRSALLSVLSEKENHSPNKSDAETMDDKFKGGGAKKMKDDLTAKEKEKITNYDELGHDDATSAGRAGPSTKMRSNDNKQGDKKIVNPINAPYKKEN